MGTFRRWFAALCYHLDCMKARRINVRLEHFDVVQDDQIHVCYRLGRQRLLNTMSIQQFEHDYFDQSSFYDQHRLTRFRTLQNCVELFRDNPTCQEQLLQYIKKEAKREQPF